MTSEDKKAIEKLEPYSLPAFVVGLSVLVGVAWLAVELIIEFARRVF